MKDPSVITFDAESLLNALLYGSDELNDKINKEILLHIIPNRADDTGVVEGGHGPPLFLCSKNKKAKQRKKRKSFKAEIIKRLSPRLKCYCFSHSRVSRIQKFFLSPNHVSRQYFSVFHGRASTLQSILKDL